MLAGAKLGPGARIRKLQMDSFPDLSVIQEHLFELSLAPAGARFDFSWPVGSDAYVLTLSHSQMASGADWKLYRHLGQHSRLIWEHQTNDVTLIYNLIMSETGETNRIVLGDGKLSTVHGQLTSPEAGMGNYVSGFGQTAKQQADMSPQPIVDRVDLSQTRELMRTLSVKDLEVFSYPAFLLFFNQEYSRAIQNGCRLALILFKFEANYFTETPSVAQFTRRNALRQCLQQVKALQRRTDILSMYTENRFAILLPETDAKGAKQFAQRVERALLRNALIEGNNSLCKIRFGIACLQSRNMAARAILQVAELALSLSYQTGERIVALNTTTAENKPIEVDCSLQSIMRATSVRNGIYNYPAFLALLEREYHRATRYHESLHILQLKLKTNHIATENAAEPSSANSHTKFIQRLVATKQDADIIGLTSDGTLVVLRPGASAGCLKNLASGLAGYLDVQSWITRQSQAFEPPQLLGRILTVTSNSTSADILNLVATA